MPIGVRKLSLNYGSTFSWSCLKWQTIQQIAESPFMATIWQERAMHCNGWALFCWITERGTKTYVRWWFSERESKKVIPSFILAAECFFVSGNFPLKFFNLKREAGIKQHPLLSKWFAFSAGRTFSKTTCLYLQLKSLWWQTIIENSIFSIN